MFLWQLALAENVDKNIDIYVSENIYADYVTISTPESSL